MLRDRPYVIAAALTSVLFIYMPLLTVALPLYLTSQTQVACGFLPCAAGTPGPGLRCRRWTSLDSAGRGCRLGEEQSSTTGHLVARVATSAVFGDVR